MQQKPARFFLPLIVFSQFAGTSLWFATNAVINEIQPASSSGFANSTSIVQLGFIAGTLIFSLLTIADRFPPSIVFFFSSLVASAANLLLVKVGSDVGWLYTMRFITGFFLAGIYPVGMKIAADCFPQKLGNALGFLVGALVLGTAFPHLLRAELKELNWQSVIVFTSVLAFSGGLLVLLFIPRTRKSIVIQNDFKAAFKVFRSANFRSAAFGYFGHMWELYAFWAFIPGIISFYNLQQKVKGEYSLQGQPLNIPLWSFIIIACGCIGCIIGGMVSQKLGSRIVAFYALLISGTCCLLYPFFFNLSPSLFLIALLAWGFSVVADSPQFSAMVAQSAPAQNKGTALTIVTSIGFAITIISIQMLHVVFNRHHQWALILLSLGPAFGLISLKKFRAD